MPDDYDAHIHQLEKAALIGERHAVLALVSLLRSYRAATADLLRAAAGAGGPDTFVLQRFAAAVEEAEATVCDPEELC